mmetsp:Transcript_50950/g.127884  ORF Transcript_50950/g.127884 Transcript_50950/m.127884 type:complete len:215 (+) Transcript_50950:722-1366(+)
MLFTVLGWWSIVLGTHGCWLHTADVGGERPRGGAISGVCSHTLHCIDERLSRGCGLLVDQTDREVENTALGADHGGKTAYALLGGLPVEELIYAVQEGIAIEGRVEGDAVSHQRREHLSVAHLEAALVLPATLLRRRPPFGVGMAIELVRVGELILVKVEHLVRAGEVRAQAAQLAEVEHRRAEEHAEIGQARQRGGKVECRAGQSPVPLAWAQ